ncbi:DUF2796 domain-containing protein [Teredinibacter turnerae]|uniref:DUF2796 domain-containing protein n=1 Tax=Teredinibacter turnerae TaxID=2426 RepID=UPI001E350E30|nr:DUF2796 domain-containing protein [Teredinibacter turnerae]
MRFCQFIVIMCVSSCVNVFAEPLKAHTHGEGKLTVVFERGHLLVALETPAANLMGFEHAPQDESEREIYANALAALRAPEKLFELTPSCRLSSTDVKIPEVGHEYSDDEDVHEEEDGHEGQHMDFDATYDWQCADQRRIKIAVKLFDVFPRFKKITAEWIAFNRQSSATLDASHSTLLLAP